MAYATIGDVSARAAKRVFTGSSIPNSSQVSAYLEFTAAELDGIMGGDGYALPVPTTATMALAMLRRLNSLGAWMQVERSAQVSQDVDAATKAWDNARAELISGKIQLVDLPRLGGEAFARSQSAPTPFFTRDMNL